MARHTAAESIDRIRRSLDRFDAAMVVRARALDDDAFYDAETVANVRSRIGALADMQEVLTAELARAYVDLDSLL